MPTYRMASAANTAVIQIWGQHSGGFVDVAGAYGFYTTPRPIEPILQGIKPVLFRDFRDLNSDLIIQDSLHGTLVDNLDIVQTHILGIQDTRHLQSVDNLVLSQIHNLIVQDSLQATLADNLALTLGAINLAIHDALHVTKADIVDLDVGIGEAMSLADIQLEKLAVLTGSTGSMSDLMFKYYSGLSGLTPVAAFSTTDHQRTYWEAQTGLTGKSMGDLEDAFYDLQLIPEGPLSDRELIYWSSL